MPAGAANPSPPIGPALGQRGLNIMEFCKAFNAQTQKEKRTPPIPVVITIYADRSFTFEMRTPPMSYFLKQAAENPVRLEGAGPWQGRQGDESPCRDRREEDEGSQLRYDRIGHEDGRGFRPFDGPGSCGVTDHGNWKTFEEAREGVDRETLSARGRHQDGQGARQIEVRRDHRDRDTISASIRVTPIRWCAAWSTCRTAPAAPCGSACSRAAPRRRGRGRRR